MSQTPLPPHFLSPSCYFTMCQIQQTRYYPFHLNEMSLENEISAEKVSFPRCRHSLCRMNRKSAQQLLLLGFGISVLWVISELGIHQSSTVMVQVERGLGIQGRAASESEVSVGRSRHSTPCRGLTGNDSQLEHTWDLEESYRTRLMTAKIDCPDSLRLSTSRADWMKDRFIANITVFLERSHFNVQEWVRLKKFVPPYGWMEVDYTVIRQVISRLQEHTEGWRYNNTSGSGCTTCAVVGNGGILNGSNMGREIDSHDYVFRGNGAVIRGFENHVGRRTSFYGFTVSTLRNCLTKLRDNGFTELPGDQDTRYIHLPESVADYQWLHHLLANKDIDPRGVNSHLVDNILAKKLDKLLIIQPDFMRYIISRFLKSEYLRGPRWCLYRPSIGAVLLMTAVHMCDTVDAYGFMTDNFHQFTGYYYDRIKMQLNFSEDHDFFLERDLWKQMDSIGMIRLQRRD